MAELMQTIGETDLVEDFQNGRVERVAAKLAVEILVGFEQRNRNPLARQEQRQYHPARPASDHAASGLVDVRDIIISGLAGCRMRSFHGKNPLTLGNQVCFAFPKRRARAGALPTLRATSSELALLITTLLTLSGQLDAALSQRQAEKVFDLSIEAAELLVGPALESAEHLRINPQ